MNNTPDSPSLHLQGNVLEGNKIQTEWTVGAKITRPKGGTGGTFSVGYEVTNANGEIAYLKATDIGLLRIPGDKTKLEQMTDALNLQKFEREILDICSSGGMNRIVRAIDYGEKEVVFKGVREYVFYIIFERANGDIRSSMRNYKKSGFDWIPKAAHNLAIAVSQLHSKQISHNDIKPSNFLVFDIALQKLSDLGRATSASISGPWDSLREAGDRAYSAPEAWGYFYTPPTSGARFHHDYRKRFDLYMLGSLIYFFLTEQSLNSVMNTFLRPEHGPFNWTGTFRDVLPYLNDAHSCAMAAMDDEIRQAYGDDAVEKLSEITEAVRFLTNVDPTLRGDPKNKVAGLQMHDLQRLISRTDLLSKRFALAN